MSLSLIVIPSTVTMNDFSYFFKCHGMEQRQERLGIQNYHPSIKIWLQRRFEGLPIHNECYYLTKETYLSSKDIIEKLTQDKTNISNGCLTDVDAMGMTPLHILCCNPNATIDIIRNVKNACPKATSLQNVEGLTPIQMFLEWKGLRTWIRQSDLKTHHDYDESTKIQRREEVWQNFVLSFHDIFSCMKGRQVNVEALEVLVDVFEDNERVSIDLEGRDESTELLPFMTAASLSDCRLDVTYLLAMHSIHLLSPDASLSKM